MDEDEVLPRLTARGASQLSGPISCHISISERATCYVYACVHVDVGALNMCVVRMHANVYLGTTTRYLFKLANTLLRNDVVNKN